MRPTRRRVLQATGVALTGGATGLLVANSATDSAAAADAQLQVTGDDAVVRDTTLAAVWLDLAVEWAYTVPSGERPDHVVVEARAGTDSGDLTVVDSARSSEAFLEASGTETFEVDLLAADVLDAATLVPDSAGAVAETQVYVGAEMRLVDETDMVIAADAETATATVSVEHSDYDPDEYGELAGVGNVTVAVE